MGTWSYDTLGNDDAGDWAYGLDGCEDLSFIYATLDKALIPEDDYLESPDACEALAAVEVVARLLGHWGKRSSYSKTLDSWVEQTQLLPDKALLEKAQQVLARILADNSELKELWQETEDFENWQAAIKELATRVRI